MTHILTYENWKIQESYGKIEEGITDSWSDALHLLSDVAAGVADVVVPGSGATIDVISMLSYFIEAKIESNENEKLKFILSGLIQAYAIFDPLQIITLLKRGLDTIFSAIASKSAAAIASAKIAAASVKQGIEIIQNTLLDLVTKIATKLQDSSFGNVVKWLSEKLGVPNGLSWLKNFLINTVPTYIKKFLTLLKSLNPESIGASTNRSEGIELIVKTAGKIAINHYASKEFHKSTMKLIDEWKKEARKK